MFGVPQGSFLRPLLFNIFMCELFIILEEIYFASYADDNTPFVFEATPENVVSSLESCSASLFEWFSNNQMRANPEKCQLLMNVNRSANIKIGEHTISDSYCEKLPGVKIDSHSNLTISKQLLKKPARRYMFWLELRLLCVFQKQFFQGSV